MSKQESMESWHIMAKYYAKAEKETIVPYVFIRIEDRTTREVMKTFDVSRNAYSKNLWFFRWKLAEFQCQRPKNDMVQTLCFYDKKTGLDLGFDSLLSKLTSAKAKITLIKDAIDEYKEKMKMDLFFDESSDETFIRLKCKLETYIKRKEDLENQIKEEVGKLKGASK